MDCLTCRWSMGRLEADAWRLERDHGYRRGNGYSDKGCVLVCDKQKMVAPTHCLQWEKEPGSDDGMDAEPTMEG